MAAVPTIEAHAEVSASEAARAHVSRRERLRPLFTGIFFLFVLFGLPPLLTGAPIGFDVFLSLGGFAERRFQFLLPVIKNRDRTARVAIPDANRLPHAFQPTAELP